jgi:cyclopropane-fatty-acyl-phospholipid synthase
MNDYQQYLKKWWENKDNPLHAHGTEQWFRKYYEEFRPYFVGSKAIVDAGCGSGEFLDYMVTDFEKIIAIDYSDSMLAKLSQRNAYKENISKVTIASGDIMEIEKFVITQQDIIFSNGVIQYLTEMDIQTFILNCTTLLNPGGKLILANIPDFNSKCLYDVGFYHKIDVEWTAKVLLRSIIKREIDIARTKISKLVRGFFKPLKVAKDPMGYWHPKPFFHNFLTEGRFNFEIVNSKYLPYGYRYHVIIHV